MSFILLGFIPSSSFIPISFYSSDFTHRIYTRHRPPSSLHKFHHALVHFTCSQDHITDRNDTSKQSISNTKNSNRFSASPSRRRFLQHAALLLTATVTTLTPILCDSSSSTSRNTAHAVSFNFPPEFVDGRTESQLLHDFKQLASTGLVTKSDDEWLAELGENSYYVLRQSATERPFTSNLLKEDREGTFCCKGCKTTPLFASIAKYNSGTGWPSFKDRLEGVQVLPGTTADIINLRREVVCFTCKGHLGHVFCDGPAPTGYRYCINGVSLVFEPKSN